MRKVTIAEIKRRARNRADMQHSGFISDEELLDMINEAYCELYDTLVVAFQNYYIAEETIQLVPGTSAYPFPDDFYKIISVDFQNGNSWETLFPFNELERNSVLTTTATIPNATIRLRYIPAPVTFTDDADEIDGIAGWEALLITDVAIMMLDKEESDTSALERRRMREYARIQTMAQNRDVTMPGTVTDVTVYDLAYIHHTLRYRFYGNNIEFISVEYVGV